MSTLPQKNRAEEREDREVGRFQEKERGKRKEKVLRGKGQRGRERVAQMRVLNPLGDRKANLPNMVTLKQEVQLVTCHP